MSSVLTLRWSRSRAFTTVACQATTPARFLRKYRVVSSVAALDMRHGVSRLRSGRRHTVGIIFHDAR
ncbi:2OG-Fe(II) oxygenase [Archangium violaceum]|uniref:2OG-Fe(II) oxygenase n=1 Tax=Archangium violaceum TaxID=83451 RepID=UPI0037C15B13